MFIRISILFLTFFGMLISVGIVSAETTTALKTEKIRGAHV